MKVYLILHHEIMGLPGNYRADEMVFYTASSLEKAVQLIRDSGVDKWSWWQVQQQDLDGHEWPEHVAYYSCRGRKIKSPPYDKCVKIFQREGRFRDPV